MPSIGELERWLTAGQVASRLDYTRQAVNSMAKERRIRAVHVGSFYEDGRGVWIFDPEAVERMRRERQERRRD